MTVGRSARSWSWASDVVAPAAQATTETIWLYAYVMVLTPPEASYPGFGAIVSLFILAALLGRCSRTLPWRHSVNRSVVLLLSVLAVPAWLLAVLVPDGSWMPTAWVMREATLAGGGVSAAVVFSTGVVALYAWCRGLWMGIVPAESEALGKWFMGGAAALVALFALLALARGTGVDRFTGTLQLLVLSYFVVGPSVIALVHVGALRDNAAAGRSTSLAWILALIAPMALIVVAGLLLSNEVAPVLARVMHAALWLVFIISDFVLWLAYWPLVFLTWLVHLLEVSGPAVPKAAPPSRFVGPAGFDFQATDSLDYAPLAAIAVFVVLFLYFLFRRQRGRPLRDAEEERSSVWSWRLLAQQMRAVWRAFVGQMRAQQPRALARMARVLAGAAATSKPEDIRALYRRFLGWSAAHGHPRRAAATPEELLLEIATAMAPAATPAALITRQYERARYGDVPVDGDTLAECLSASEQLEEMERRVPASTSHVGAQDQAARSAAARRSF